jgi:hypothetical protein
MLGGHSTLHTVVLGESSEGMSQYQIPAYLLWPPYITLRGYWPLVFLFSGYLIAKQLAILKILNNLKHATDRLQMPSSPRVVK